VRGRRPRGDDGSALLEFSYLAVLLMVPLVYLLLTVLQVQAAAFGTTEAARQAGRAFVQADSLAQGRDRARTAVDLALEDQGVDDAPEPVVSCAPLPPARCLEPGARVQVTVSYRVRLRFLGAFFAGSTGPTVPVTATHVQFVDRARSS
jgi:hypothetical protein